MYKKLWEKGLVVIPIAPESKFPAHGIEGFDVWAEHGQTEELIESFEKDYPLDRYGIAVVCGKASGVFCIDIDTDLNTLTDRIPMSPVIRLGDPTRLGARFFKYSEQMELWLTNRTAKCMINGKKHEASIQGHGKYIVIPPSIHPKTLKKYKYATEDTLENFDLKDLPILTEAQWQDVVDDFERFHEITNTKTDSGRNNVLVSIVTAMRSRGEPEMKIVEEIYNHDKNNHSPRLFTDPNEQYRAKNEEEAKLAAISLVANVSRTLARRKLIPYVPYFASAAPNFQVIETKKFKAKPYPESTGAMKAFIDYCQNYSNGDQSCLGLGGAISFISAISANRFCVKHGGRITTPNSYILNLAPSGFGKETPQRLLYNLLQEHELLGSGGYKSAASLHEGFPKQQERLDIIDEASDFLSQLSGKDGHQSGMSEALAAFFTKADQFYAGYTTKGDGKNKGAVWNPHVSILASTTPALFRETITRKLITGGFFPRFLIFMQDELGEYKGEDKSAANETIEYLLKRFVKEILKIEKKRHPDFTPDKNLLGPNNDLDGNSFPFGIRYKPTELTFTEEAKKRVEEYDRHCFMAKRKSVDSLDSAFIARFSEHVIKLSMLHAISDFDIGAHTFKKIPIESVNWAIEVIEAQWFNAKSIYMISSSSNQVESMNNRVLEVIEKNPWISARDIAKKCRFLKTKQLKEIIEDLVITQSIKAVTQNTGSNNPLHTSVVLYALND